MPGLEIEDFFRGDNLALGLFESVRELIESCGPGGMRVTRSQIAFSRRRQFAWVWMPGRYLRGETPPLVLSLSLPRRDDSLRWKEVVEPHPHRWMHHLEVRDAADLDNEVLEWIREAYDAAA